MPNNKRDEPRDRGEAMREAPAKNAQRSEWVGEHVVGHRLPAWQARLLDCEVPPMVRPQGRRG